MEKKPIFYKSFYFELLKKVQNKEREKGARNLLLKNRRVKKMDMSWARKVQNENEENVVKKKYTLSIL